MNFVLCFLFLLPTGPVKKSKDIAYEQRRREIIRDLESLEDYGRRCYFWDSRITPLELKLTIELIDLVYTQYFWRKR